MKKLLIVLLSIILLSGCSEKIKYTYDIVSDNVDMSAYKGVNSTNHCFKEISVSELFKVVDNKSSGIFLLGRNTCYCCQKVTRYINEVAMDLGVTVYYIDAYNEKENLAENKELQDKLYEYMYDILGKDENGEKVLLTPHLFQVINGKMADNQICFDGYELDESPTLAQIEKLEKAFAKILKPFAENSQD